MQKKFQLTEAQFVSMLQESNINQPIKRLLKAEKKYDNLEKILSSFGA
jgi:hypothetical protein